MQKILVFIDWYLPGTSAGGPVRSIANVVDHLGGEAHFSIITRITDYCSTEPYPGVTPDRWTLLNDHCRVFYLSPGRVSPATLRHLIRETPFDTAWINGIYSWHFSILPLFLLKGSGKRIVVSPRGMLNPQAFTSGKLKKRLFIALARWSGLYKGVVFHATNEDEKKNILQQLCDTTPVIVAPNLPAKLSRKKRAGSREDEVGSKEDEVSCREDEVSSRKYEVGRMEYEGKSKEDGVGREENPQSAFRNPHSEIRNPETEFPTSDSTSNTEHRLPNTEYRSPITEYRLPVTGKHKAPGSLKLVSIARISPEKGTLHALRFLKELKEGAIQFDLYGPVYNEAYWKECRQVIASLPSNVTVTWHGPAGGEQIWEVLSGAHFLLMPTEGENFGHSILEALSEGCPVIISDRTPWRDLEARKAGFDLPLEEPSRFVSTLKWAVNLDDITWKEWSGAACTLAMEYAGNSSNVEASRKLFSEE